MLIKTLRSRKIDDIIRSENQFLLIARTILIKVKKFQFQHPSCGKLLLSLKWKLRDSNKTKCIIKNNCKMLTNFTVHQEIISFFFSAVHHAMKMLKVHLCLDICDSHQCTKMFFFFLWVVGNFAIWFFVMFTLTCSTLSHWHFGSN